MGNNGGFNPYRDANGEFTDPTGSGKPGRSRARGAGGSTAARVGSTGVQRATALGKGIPNPGIDYRSRKVSRTPSDAAIFAAGEVKSSAAYTLGRIGPQAGENAHRVARGLAPLKPSSPRTVIRPKQ